MYNQDINNETLYFHQEQNSQDATSSYSWFGFMLFVILLVMGLTGFRYLMQATSFPIKQINIQGEFTYLDESFLHELARESVNGGFFSLNVDAIRKHMQSEAWVDTIMVRRIWPDTLAINVLEQKPIARWNSVSMLNHHGKVFTPDLSTIPNNLPSVTAPEGSEQLILEQLKLIQEQVASIGISLTAIHLSERRAWKLSFDQLEVLLGKTNFEKRMQRFIKLVPVALNGDYRNISLIDLRYTNGFSINHKDSKQLITDKLIIRSESSEKI